MGESFLLPLLSRLSIADKHARVIPLSPNWAQLTVIQEIERALRNNEPARIINLKARQLGISTITEACFYVLSFIFPNTNGLVIANEVDNANHLLSMTDRYWMTDPYKLLYTTKYQAKNTLAWNETQSQIRTTTAGNKAAGRSRTVQFLHASEVAFWDNAETVMTGLLQAVPEFPRTIVNLESTANGRGNYFHTTWNQAVEGESRYVPLFFPWWMHYEYRASYIRLPSHELGRYDEEEKNLLRLFEQGYELRHGARVVAFFQLPKSHWEDAIAWRRWAIFNLCQGDLIKFHQEYPSTPEEAFVATGTNVFPLEHLKACFDERRGRRGRLVRNGTDVDFIRDITGPLTLFKTPSTNHDLGQYAIGGDATATMHGDFACAQVINRRSYEQVAIYRERIDPAHFAEELAKLGIYFNTALISAENEGPGYATIGWLQSINYPRLFQSVQADGLPGRYTGKYGWSSSYRTKDLAISWLLRLLIERGVTIHDRKTFAEMDNYVTLEGGGYGPSGAKGKEKHDDTVMALGIAVTSSMQDGPLPAYGTMSPDAGRTERETRPVWEDWEVKDEYDPIGEW